MAIFAGAILKLSNNFTLEELTRTDTGLPNNPTTGDIRNLFFLCQYILQPIRSHWGMIQINSGYRSEQVNRAIRGATQSQHLTGEAADIYPLTTSLDAVFDWVRCNLIFGQVIVENVGTRKWVHVSLPRMDKTNKEAMRYDGKSYVVV